MYIKMKVEKLANWKSIGKARTGAEGVVVASEIKNGRCGREEDLKNISKR